MDRILVSVTIGIFLAFAATTSYSAEKAPQKVVDLAQSTLSKLGTDPVIVRAVKTENTKGKTLEQIKAQDKKWLATPGIADFMKALMDNECGKHLIDIKKKADYYSEIFVTDNQGANVCMSDKTTDYWQGDEPKFTESFRDGKGTLYISDVKFDDSTQSYLVHVSVPVRDTDKTIGVLVIGVDIEKVK